MLGVEMTSTGEVGCIGRDLNEALLKSMTATGFKFPSKGVLLSLGPVADKYWFCDEARVIAKELKLPIFATVGTADMLAEEDIPCTAVGKRSDEDQTAMDLIDEAKVDLVINIPREFDQYGRPDGYLIRRRAVDQGVPLITDLQLARAVIEALRWIGPDDLQVVAWNDYLRQPTDTI